MKRKLISLLLLLPLLACSLPLTIAVNTSALTTKATSTDTQAVIQPTVTSTINVPTATSPAPTSSPTPSFIGVNKSLDGISLSIPSCLATDATAAVIPASDTEADMPAFAINPEYRKISFVGYPLSNTFWEPMVQVIPIDQYIAMDADIATGVSNLQKLLQSQPKDIHQEIPFLLIQNAAQLFQAKIDDQTFQNGQGIEFLTEYGQAFDPVNNTDLFYSFQGLTKDGKYWISIILPINASYLQADYNSTAVPAGGINAPDLNSSTFSADYQNYYAQMVQKLASTTNDQFSPSLSCIHQLVQSIHIDN